MNSFDNHLLDILSLIDNLQKNITNNDNNLNNPCLRPIIGPNQPIFFNTRPVTFYLCNNTPLTVNGTDFTTSIFRVENVNNDCVTVRLLIDGDPITSTNEYATININCIAAIRCLDDINIAL